MIIEVDDLKINYKVSGKGKDLVILHGWGGSIKSFEPVHHELENYFRTFSFDLPGFGMSDHPPVPWGVADYTQLIKKVLAKLEIHTPIIISHSFGGRIAINYAADNETHKLIFVDSAGIKPKRTLKYYIKVYLYKTVKNLLKLPILKAYSEILLEKYKRKLGSEDYRNISGVMQQTLVKVVNEDLKHRLPLIKSPTLLIWGENDTATPVSDGKIMERLIPDAGLVVLKNAGHFCYLEKLGDFLIIVKNFLKNDMEVDGA